MSSRRIKCRLYKCPVCGIEFHPINPQAKFCSKHCQRKGRVHKKKEYWYLNGNGYIEGQALDHGVWRRMKYHRWIFEKEFGFRMPRHIHVHHIDGNKTNNKFSNLQILPASVHIGEFTNKERAHKKGYKLKITAAQRLVISQRAKRLKLNQQGLEAIAKARPKEAKP